MKLKTLVGTAVVSFALGMSAALLSSPAAAEPGGTCAIECTPETDCDHPCTVDAPAAGLQHTTCGGYGRCFRPPPPPPQCPNWRRKDESCTFVYSEGFDFFSGYYCDRAYNILSWDEDACTGDRQNYVCEIGHYAREYDYNMCQFFIANSCRVC